MKQHPQENVLIMGSGGIGGTIAAKLCAKGVDVTVITRNPEIADVINKQGLRATYDQQQHTAHPRASAATADLGDSPTATFTLCIIAVPPSSAEQALEDALPWLHEDAPVLCCPNGLIEERLALKISSERVVGGIVTFAGSMHGPGEVEQTSTGGITLGRLPDAARASDPTLDHIEALFSGCFPIHRTSNLRGSRWSKLALNCGVSSLGTVGGDTLGVLMRHRIVRRMMLETITEAVEVAHAEEVELVKVAGTLNLNWLALGRWERRRRGSAKLIAKHTLLLLAGAPYRNMRSSMLRGLERGRKPPADYLNGEITARASKHNLDAPVNAALQEALVALGEGEQKPSLSLLRSVYERTRR
ncbi:MAG: 2-dehydropantoate 2-reductase [Myxococcota bacterium]|nr:2-dehydropantoate 2-reductase [Myxococcota bacterium]